MANFSEIWPEASLCEGEYKLQKWKTDLYSKRRKPRKSKKRGCIFKIILLKNYWVKVNVILQKLRWAKRGKRYDWQLTKWANSLKYNCNEFTQINEQFLIISKYSVVCRNIKVCTCIKFSYLKLLYLYNEIIYNDIHLLSEYSCIWYICITCSRSIKRILIFNRLIQ